MILKISAKSSPLLEKQEFIAAVFFFLKPFKRISDQTEKMIVFVHCSLPTMSDPWENLKQVLYVCGDLDQHFLKRCTDDIITGAVAQWGRSGQTWKQERDKRADLGRHLIPTGKNRVWAGHRRGQQKEGGVEGGIRPGIAWLAGYKYVPRWVQVSSDQSLDTMRLLALLLMIGAAGKDTEIDKDTSTHTFLDI